MSPQIDLVYSKQIFSVFIFLILYMQCVQQVKSETSPGLCLNEASDKFCPEVVLTKKNHFDAETSCNNKGKHLVTILNYAEQLFLYNLLTNFNVTKFWIGLTYFGNEGVFYWRSNYPGVPVTFWRPGQMDNEVGMQGCASFSTKSTRPNATWYDDNCSNRLPFICTNRPAAVLKHVHMDNVTCPPGFTLIDFSCFLIKADFSDHFTWESARSECRSMRNGSDLASVLSQHQQDLLTVMMSNQTRSVWIGLRLYNGEHRWARQHPVIYTNWKAGEPNGKGGKEPCVMMYSRVHNVGEWNDQICSTQMGYICEADPVYSKNVAPSLGPLFKRGSCSHGFYEFDSACYIVVGNRNVARSSQPSYSDPDALDQFCASLDSHVDKGTRGPVIPLAVHTGGDMAFVRALLYLFGMGSQPNTTWVGLKLIISKGDVVFDSADKSTVGLSFFIPVVDWMPWLQLGNHCFALTLGSRKFQPLNCNGTELIPSCMYYLANHPFHPSNTSPNLHCPDNWYRLGDQCYKLSFNERMNFSLARERCRQSWDGRPDLVSIHSVQEQQFLNTLLSEHGEVQSWIGMRVISSVNAPELSWVDGTAISYLHFRTGQPSHVDPNSVPEECVHLRIKTHEWNDISCNKSLDYICKMRALPNPTSNAPTSTTPTIPANCPAKISDLRETSTESCYTFRIMDTVWQNASRQCQLLGGSLPSLHNKEVTQFLWRQHPRSNETNFKGFWIGLRQDELQFEWSDGTVVDYLVHSVSGEDRNVQQPGCFAMTADDVWSELDCSTTLPYVCQFYLPGSKLLKLDAPNVFHPWPSMSALRSCREGFELYRGHCYQLFGSELSWNEAEAACRLKRSHLARADTPEDHEFLVSRLSTLSESRSAWIGLSVSNGQLSWVDQQPVAFTRLSMGGLTLFRGNWADRSCTAIRSSQSPLNNGLWILANCTGKHHFLCRHDPVPPPPPPASPCQRGWTGSYAGNCYRSVNQTMTFEAGKKHCKKFGGELLSLADGFEASYVRSWLHSQSDTASVPMIWLGLQVTSFMNWTWTDGSPVRYTDLIRPDNTDVAVLGCYGFKPSVNPAMTWGLNCSSSRAAVVCKRKNSKDSPRIYPRCANVEVRGDRGKLVNLSYNLNVSGSAYGRPCIRWDVAQLSTLHIQLPYFGQLRVSEALGYAGYYSFAENLCSEVYSGSSADIPYGCFVTPTLWQNCTYQKCAPLSAETTNPVGIVLGLGFGLMVVLGVACVGFFLWRGRSHVRAGFIPFRRFRADYEPGSFTETNGGGPTGLGTSFHNPIYTPLADQ